MINCFFINKSSKLLMLFLMYLVFIPCIYAEDIKKVWEISKEKTMKGMFEESWKEYEELLVKNPRNYEIVLGAGCLKYYQAERSIDSQQLDNAKSFIQEAEHFFDSAIQLAESAKEKANSLYNKGNCNLLIANVQRENPQLIEECINFYRNAVRFYREAIEDKPDFLEAKRNLEHALYQLKQLIQKKEDNKKEDKQDSQSDKEQQYSTMFLETKTDLPDSEVRVIEEQPNVVELKKKGN